MKYTIRNVERIMVIEWLKFSVTPELRERFIQLDNEIWTPVLADHEGFLGKEVWISAEDLGEVVFVIHWNSLEQWQAVPPDVLAATDVRFNTALGETPTLSESKCYQVRKFCQTPAPLSGPSSVPCASGL